MKILFFVLFLGMLQPATAADAFSKQELDALEKIRATVEGRLRYNEVLLSMLSDEGCSPRERLQNYFQEIGSALGKSLKNGTQKNLTAEDVDDFMQTQIRGFQRGVQRDMDMLNVTHKIFCTVEHHETDFRKNLYFLAMDIVMSYVKLRYELEENTEILDNFHEWHFYKLMKNCLSDIQLSSHFMHLEKKFQYAKRSEVIGLLYNPEEEANDVRGVIDSLRAIPEQLTQLTAYKEEYRAHLLLIQGQIRSLRPAGAIKNWDNFGEKKQYFDDFFWPRMQVRENISDLEKIVAESKHSLDCTLADFNLKELLGEETTEKPLSKTQLKKLNRQKPASSVVVHDTASVSTPGKKVVQLPSSNRVIKAELKQMAPTPIPNTTCAITRLAAKTSAHKSTTEAHMREEVDSIKKPPILCFRDALRILKDKFKATIEEGAIYTIRLRGPTGALTNIYCHKPHGAQDDKSWPAWRINMKEGLRAAGYEW